MRLGPVIVITFCAAAAFAQGRKEVYTVARGADAQHQAATRPTLHPYVAANITETLYHELAHALIDAVELPIYGFEEYAADVFAVVLMNRAHDRDTVTDMTAHVARSYRDFAESAGTDTADLELWDVHGTDLQRYYNFACLMYGADPEGRAALEAVQDLPEQRAEYCEADYERAAWSWSTVLDDLSRDAPGTSLHLDWTVKGHEILTDYISDEIDRLNALLVFPSRINVSVIPCGEPNAFYDPDYAEIQICTELAESLAAKVAP